MPSPYRRLLHVGSPSIIKDPRILRSHNRRYPFSSSSFHTTTFAATSKRYLSMQSCSYRREKSCDKVSPNSIKYNIGRPRHYFSLLPSSVPPSTLTISSTQSSSSTRTTIPSRWFHSAPLRAFSNKDDQQDGKDASDAKTEDISSEALSSTEETLSPPEERSQVTTEPDSTSTPEKEESNDAQNNKEEGETTVNSTPTTDEESCLEAGEPDSAAAETTTTTTKPVDPNEVSYAFTAPPPLSQASQERVQAIFEKILWLDMVEVHLLTQLVNEKMGVSWNESDQGFVDGGGAMKSSSAGVDGSNDAQVAEVKTIFDLKLVGFDAKAKIKVIKEIRAIAGLGLKEAKELVESAPKVVQKGLKQDKAEELKAQLEAVGAEVELV